MHNPIIFRKIQLLGYVISDIRSLERVMLDTSDPELLLMYRDDMKLLIAELNEVSARCLFLLKAYLEGCRETSYPVVLDYYRVYKELSKAER